MGDQTSPVLAVEDLTIRFAGAPTAVVDDIGFSVGRGQTLAIVGESGCGKSVTSLALMGLLPPTARVSGRAMFGDVDLLSMPARAAPTCAATASP